MVIRVLNITPKIGVLTFDQLVDTDFEELFDQSNVTVILSHCSKADDAYGYLIYTLAQLFAKEICLKYKQIIERHGKKFNFGLHYEYGRKEHGFQLIMDFDNNILDYPSILANYFEWDSIACDPELSFEDIQDIDFSFITPSGCLK